MAKGGHRYGAGRPGWRRKAESCLRVDVREFARRRLLGAASFSWTWTNNYTGEQVGSISIRPTGQSLILTYTANGWPISQSIALERTACPFGGSRPWMRCGQCHRRVAVLYFSGREFVCRHCGRVAYASQSEDELGRGWRRQRKLEARLGEDWERPSGMRTATYERILERIYACENNRDASLAAFLARSGLMGWA